LEVKCGGDTALDGRVAVTDKNSILAKTRTGVSASSTPSRAWEAPVRGDDACDGRRPSTIRTLPWGLDLV
jgi:hypothetical protein